MDYDEEDPWAKQTPVEEKEDVLNESPESVAARLPASTSTDSIVHKDVDSDDDQDEQHKNNEDDDEEAWNADSDAEAGNEDAFVEATSRMSLSASFVAEEHDNQESFGGFDDLKPIAGPSTLSNAFESTTTSSPPPLDEFDEDDDDGFGDFGKPAEGDTINDDDDDFGAFDEAGADAQDAFGYGEGQNGQPHGAPSVQSEQASAPSSAQTDADDFGPPANIDFESTWQDKEALTSAIIRHFEKAYPNLYHGLDTSPARQEAWNKIDMTLDPEEIILRNNPGAKRILEEYTNPATFPYKPWEWKRSQIRIQAMREQGIPVNLDDFAPPTKMQPLRLPSIRTTAASPTKDKRPIDSTSNGRRSGANSRSASPNRLGRTNSNPASPSSASRSPSRQNSQIIIPPLDKEKCEQLANMSEEDMSMKALGELEILRNDLQNCAIEASQHLTALLEQKETLSGQNQTYNAMISDLVAQAQKLRSMASSGGITRKTSIRRSNSNSKPPSRPSSPAPGNSGLKSSIGRSAAGQSTSAGKDPSRRTSLW